MLHAASVGIVGIVVAARGCSFGPPCACACACSAHVCRLLRVARERA
jgi:hypothetical protein